MAYCWDTCFLSPNTYNLDVLVVRLCDWLCEYVWLLSLTGQASVLLGGAEPQELCEGPFSISPWLPQEPAAGRIHTLCVCIGIYFSPRDTHPDYPAGEQHRVATSTGVCVRAEHACLWLSLPSHWLCRGTRGAVTLTSIRPSALSAPKFRKSFAHQ